MKDDTKFHERLLSHIVHTAESFPRIFCKVTPDHRFIKMLITEMPLEVCNCVGNEDMKFLPFDGTTLSQSFEIFSSYFINLVVIDPYDF